MKALLLHALLSVVFGSMDCPVYVCGDLEDGLCSTISEDGNVITINENGCPNYGICSFVNMKRECSYVEKDPEYETPEDFDLLSVILSSYESYEWFNFTVDEWKSSKYCQVDRTNSLKSGSWNDECDSDSDCELINGRYAICNCHLNGKSYCKPDFNSTYSKIGMISARMAIPIEIAIFTTHITKHYTISLSIVITAQT